MFQHNIIYIFLLFRQENIDKKNQYKLIQCLKAFMNNKVSSVYFCPVTKGENLPNTMKVWNEQNFFNYFFKFQDTCT